MNTPTTGEAFGRVKPSMTLTWRTVLAGVVIFTAIMIAMVIYLLIANAAFIAVSTLLWAWRRLTSCRSEKKPLTPGKPGTGRNKSLGRPRRRRCKGMGLEILVGWLPPLKAWKDAVLGREIQFEVTPDEQSSRRTFSVGQATRAIIAPSFRLRITNNDDQRPKRIRGGDIKMSLGRRHVERYQLLNISDGGPIDVTLAHLEDSGWMETYVMIPLTARFLYAVATPEKARVTIRLHRVGGAFRNIQKPLASTIWWNHIIPPAFEKPRYFGDHLNESDTSD